MLLITALFFLNVGKLTLNALAMFIIYNSNNNFISFNKKAFKFYIIKIIQSML